MGQACSTFNDIFNDAAVMDEFSGRAGIKMNSKLHNFVKRTHSLLCVALPECSRIASAKDEASIHQQIISVLDNVAAYHHEELTADERIQLLTKCVPDTEPQFREAVERYNGSKQSKIGRGDVDLLYIISLWYEADQDNSGELEQEEVRGLLHKMNVSISQQDLKELVDYVDKNSDGVVQFNEFYKMYMLLTTVTPVNSLFDLLCTRTITAAGAGSAGAVAGGPVPVLGFYDVARFLRSSQHVLYQHDDLMRAVRHAFGELRSIEGTLGVARRQFQNALLDTRRNSWLDPKESIVHQDMTQPLTHYFIDSSHNTYLRGNQLSSESDAEMYRMALREGCRCVEIDCWDGPDGKPIVWHGGTLTTKITFLEVIKAIKSTAFATSQYPVILSLEVHTNPAQSDMMAQIMSEVFGDMLLTAADAEMTKPTSVEFSPAGLLGKIIVKGKRRSPSGLPPESPDREFSDALNDLCFLNGKKFVSVASTMRFPHYAIMSIDEKRMEAWERDLDTFANVNKVCFTRTYPRGTRVDSSNYNPQPGWNIGAQVVALNYQTSDFPMRLNRAKFLVNGRCGYILKPRCLRMHNVPAGTYGDRKQLTITVICGVRLPRPGNATRGEIIDPYVQIFITGVEGDDTSATPKETAVIDNNGFNPTWNETFTFTLQSVEMAILTLRIMEKDTVGSDDFIAENSIPVSALRLGYRAVPLLDLDMNPVPPPACLFCHFDLNDSGMSIDTDDL
jgi:phosphatidylinositol phospholipase C delta